jgi:gas vesicle protein
LIESEVMDQEEAMRKLFGFLTGVLAGAVVGAVAALLLAPYPGSELQDRVRTRIEELIEEGKRAADARRAELQAELESFKRGVPAASEMPASQPEA